MKHHELHEFDPTPIADAHLHHTRDFTAEETVTAFRSIMAHHNLCRVLFASLTMQSPIEDVLTFYCKSCLAPAGYAAPAINHHYDGRDTAAFFLDEIKKYVAMGCDGIKMLEGKPSMNRAIHTPCLSDAVYEPFFAYAEENGIPLLVHLGDPDYFWDITKIDEYAIKRGWYNPPGSKSLKTLRAELEAVLAKFPRIKMTLAHFYFMDEDLVRLDKLLSTYPNVTLDLAPGTHFVGLSKTPEASRDFFLKYYDRILYATDTFNVLSENAEAQWWRHYVTRATIEKDGEHVQGGKTYRFLSLPREAQDAIYRNNFTRIYGNALRPLDAERILAECRLIASERTLTPADADRLATITAHFEDCLA